MRKILRQQAAIATVGAFQDFIRNQHFPCVAAKSALAMQGMKIVVADDLRCDRTDTQILSALRAVPDQTKGFAAFKVRETALNT